MSDMIGKDGRINPDWIGNNRSDYNKIITPSPFGGCEMILLFKKGLENEVLMRYFVNFIRNSTPKEINASLN